MSIKPGDVVGVKRNDRESHTGFLPCHRLEPMCRAAGAEGPAYVGSVGGPITAPSRRGCRNRRGAEASDPRASPGDFLTLRPAAC